MTISDQQCEAIREMFDCIIGIVRSAGPMGKSGTVIDDELIDAGFASQQYSALMDALVEAGRLHRHGARYFVAADEDGRPS
jgi:hypothetical protein